MASAGNSLIAHCRSSGVFVKANGSEPEAREGAVSGVTEPGLGISQTSSRTVEMTVTREHLSVGQNATTRLRRPVQTAALEVGEVAAAWPVHRGDRVPERTPDLAVVDVRRQEVADPERAAVTVLEVGTGVRERRVSTAIGVYLAD